MSVHVSESLLIAGLQCTNLQMSSIYELARAKGWLPVLIFLFYKGRSTMYRLSVGIKLSKDAIRRAVAVLVSLGLCHVEPSNTFPFAKKIELTLRGEQLMKTPLGELGAFFFHE